MYNVHIIMSEYICMSAEASSELILPAAGHLILVSLIITTESDSCDLACNTKFKKQKKLETRNLKQETESGQMINTGKL